MLEGLIEMKTILVAEMLSDAEQAQLRAAAPNETFFFAQTQDVTLEQLQDADILIGNVDSDLLKQTDHLEWMQLVSSGADYYTKEAKLHDKFLATTATGCYGTGIAEYMVCMLLTMMKKIPTYLDFQRQQVWRDAGSVASPMGKRVLIVGTGNLGTEFARRMRPFGCEIVGVRRRTGACPPEYDRMCQMADLKSELPQADVVALCLPGTKETYHLFDAEMLSLCKEGAFLMNVGRGTVIPSEVFCSSTLMSRFGGVWVDVLEQEPLEDGDPLFSAENLIITPHITGGWHLDITRRNIMELCVRNLKAYLGGEPLEHVLDWSTGYCK